MDEGRYLHSTSGGLGFAPAAAVGAALAGRPRRRWWGTGIPLAPQALYTAKAHGLDVAFIVLNNRGYGILQGFAEGLYPGQGQRVPGLFLDGVDFLLLAQAFGVPGWRADTPESPRKAWPTWAEGRSSWRYAWIPRPTGCFDGEALRP